MERSNVRHRRPRKAKVVYYLSTRSRPLDHPHLIDVPISSHAAGLRLRDVIDRLVVLRGHAMPAMYSWSCKRCYKNGFVWHDLAADDLVSPVATNEYVLKGSEILDHSPADLPRLSTSSAQLDNPEQQPPPASARMRDASTQTEDEGGRGRGATRMGGQAHDEPRELKFESGRWGRNPCFSEEGEISQRATGSWSSSPAGRMNTLESLIRADAIRMKNYRLFGEEEVLVPMKAKMKVANMLMQLITCGSFSVKDRRSFRTDWTYKPRSSQMKFTSPMVASSIITGELEFMPENPSVLGTKKKERNCCSRRMAGDNQQMEEGYRSSKSPYSEYNGHKMLHSVHSESLPQTTKITSHKQLRKEIMVSPITDATKPSTSLTLVQRQLSGCRMWKQRYIADASSIEGSSVS